MHDEMVSVLLIALSLSIDALGVGFAYGLRGIRVPLSSKALMTLLSMLCALAAACFGKCLYAFLPPAAGEWVSVAILTCMGGYMLWSAWREMRPRRGGSRQRRQYALILASFKLTVTIIRRPAAGDMDHSKQIDLKEAIYLGLALSLDSLGAGIGYSMTSSSALLFPLLIGLFQFLFVSVGTLAGRKLHRGPWRNENLLSFLPGVIMLGLALARILGR